MLSKNRRILLVCIANWAPELIPVLQAGTDLPWKRKQFLPWRCARSAFGARLRPFRGFFAIRPFCPPLQQILDFPDQVLFLLSQLHGRVIQPCL